MPKGANRQTDGQTDRQLFSFIYVVDKDAPVSNSISKTELFSCCVTIYGLLQVARGAWFWFGLLMWQTLARWPFLLHLWQIVSLNG